MAFEFSSDHLDQYIRQGYTVFRSILPAALIKDLRREAAKGLQIARQLNGPQAQRIQPVSQFAQLDQRPFRDYAQLPVLLDAIRRVVSPQAWHGEESMLGILLEPSQSPWCTNWHRDVTGKTAGIDADELEHFRAHRVYFNQVNCALYDDSSTWYVPGSDRRENLPGEQEHADQWPCTWQGQAAPDISHEQMELTCLDYCRSMPRAVCLHLGPGDFALYRPLGWHLGNYVPYRIRATLHDVVFTPQSKAWYEKWHRNRAEAAKAAAKPAASPA